MYNSFLHSFGKLQVCFFLVRLLLQMGIIDPHDHGSPQVSCDLLVEHFCFLARKPRMQGHIRMLSKGSPAAQEIGGDGSVLLREAVVAGSVEGRHEVLNKVLIDVTCNTPRKVKPIEVDFEPLQVLFFCDVVILVSLAIDRYGRIVVQGPCSSWAKRLRHDRIQFEPLA